MNINSLFKKGASVIGQGKKRFKHDNELHEQKSAQDTLNRLNQIRDNTGKSPITKERYAQAIEAFSARQARGDKFGTFGLIPPEAKINKIIEKEWQQHQRLGAVLEHLIGEYIRADGETEDAARQANRLAIQVIEDLVLNEVAQGNYGPGARTSITLFGCEKQVDALDLLLFAYKLLRDDSRPNKTEADVQKIWMMYADANRHPEILHTAVARLGRLDEQSVFLSHNYFDRFRGCNKAWTDQERVKAYQVLTALPRKYADQVRHLSPQKLDQNTFKYLLHSASRAGDLLQPLQNIRDRVITHLPVALKERFYSNPNIAYRYLPTEAQVEQKISDVENRQRADLFSEVKAELQNVNAAPIGRDAQAEAAFDVLSICNDLIAHDQNCVTFQDRDGLHYFSDIECPLETAIEIESPGGKRHYHANHVRLPALSHAAVIAAQQPDASDLGKRNFFKVLQGHADVVIDLRNTRDLDGGKFDYMPSHNRKTHFQDLEASAGQSKQLAKELSKTRLYLDDGAQNGRKSVDVLQFRSWPDHGVVRPEQLRQLRDIFASQIAAGKRVAVHCRAGVGRTGTLLAYTSLYQQLCNHTHNKPVSEQEMVSKILDTIVTLRQQRGLATVQNEAQLKLIMDTLRDDLKRLGRYQKHDKSARIKVNLQQFHPQSLRKDAKPLTPRDVFARVEQENSGINHGFETPPPPSENLLSDLPSEPVVQEHSEGEPLIDSGDDPQLSHNQTQADQLWSKLNQTRKQYEIETSIAQRYQNVILPKKDAIQASKLVRGASAGTTVLHANKLALDDDTFVLAQSPHTHDEVWQHWHAIFEQGADVLEVISPAGNRAGLGAHHAQFGLNFIHESLMSGNPSVSIGQFSVLDIKMTQNAKPWGYEEASFAITVKDDRTDEIKTLNYRLIEADFSQAILKAKDLQEIVASQENKSIMQRRPLWLTSQCGVGRPSAVICAEKLKTAIASGEIEHFDQVPDFLSSIVESGRAARGPLFLHNAKQLKELYVLAKDLLRQQNIKLSATKEALHRNPSFNAGVASHRKPVSLFKRLVAWFKYPEDMAVKSAKTNAPFAFTLRSFQDLLAWYKANLDA